MHRGEPIRKLLLPALLASIVLLSTSCTTFYLGRYVLWNVPTNQDYERFPVRIIANGSRAFRFEEDPERTTFLLWVSWGSLSTSALKTG